MTYAAAAALVFPALFFPESEPLTGTLLAFGTYALGFFARPVGGIVFGNLGDRVGRKAVLVATLMLMGVATTLMGLLPIAPFVATYLLSQTGTYWPVAVYMMALALITIVALAPETYGREMAEEKVEEEKVGPQTATPA